VYVGVAADMPPMTLRTIVMNTVLAVVILGVLLLIHLAL